MWRVSWCVAYLLVCGQSAGVWPVSWCVASLLVGDQLAVGLVSMCGWSTGVGVAGMAGVVCLNGPKKLDGVLMGVVYALPAHRVDLTFHTDHVTGAALP